MIADPNPLLHAYYTPLDSVMVQHSCIRQEHNSDLGFGGGTSTIPDWRLSSWPRA